MDKIKQFCINVICVLVTHFYVLLYRLQYTYIYKVINSDYPSTNLLKFTNKPMHFPASWLLGGCWRPLGGGQESQVSGEVINTRHKNPFSHKAIKGRYINIEMNWFIIHILGRMGRQGNMV